MLGVKILCCCMRLIGLGLVFVRGMLRSFEVGSPHSVPVGPQIDMSNVTRNS